MSEGLFGIHAAALELRSQRMGLITSNIANAATPGYKARDIDFAAALKARMNGASIDQASEAASLYRVPVMPSYPGSITVRGDFCQSGGSFAMATGSCIAAASGIWMKWFTPATKKLPIATEPRKKHMSSDFIVLGA